MLCVRGVMPVLEVAERHMLLEHRVAPGPRRELACLAGERVARMGGPIGELHMLAADEQRLPGAVGHEALRDVDDLDAVALRGGDRTAVGVGDAVAADFRVSRQVEQRVHPAADALAALEHAHLEAVLLEHERGLEAGEAGADDDDIRVARAGCAQPRCESGERRGGGGGGDELAAGDAHRQILRCRIS